MHWHTVCPDPQIVMIDRQARERQGSRAGTTLREKHGADLPSKSSVPLIPWFCTSSLQNCKNINSVVLALDTLSDFIFTFHFRALEKEMATHSSVHAWRVPGTGEPAGLPSMGSHRVGHNWSELAAAATAAYLPEKFHGRRSLAGYSP